MVIAPSLLRAIGTYNFDFRLSPKAKGALITANITAKGAGAATLSLTLQYYDEASGTYVALQDSEATQVAVTIAATAVTPTENFVLGVYSGGSSSVVPAAGKRRTFITPLPSSLRLVAVVATDTVTFSVGSKAVY